MAIAMAAVSASSQFGKVWATSPVKGCSITLPLVDVKTWAEQQPGLWRWLQHPSWGNHPGLAFALLAHLERGEATDAEIKQTMASEAYRNEIHPDHESAVLAVRRLFQRKAGTR